MSSDKSDLAYLVAGIVLGALQQHPALTQLGLRPLEVYDPEGVATGEIALHQLETDARVLVVAVRDAGGTP